MPPFPRQPKKCEPKQITKRNLFQIRSPVNGAYVCTCSLVPFSRWIYLLLCVRKHSRVSHASVFLLGSILNKYETRISNFIVLISSRVKFRHSPLCETHKFVIGSGKQKRLMFSPELRSVLVNETRCAHTHVQHMINFYALLVRLRSFHSSQAVVGNAWQGEANNSCLVSCKR